MQNQCRQTKTVRVGKDEWSVEQEREGRRDVGRRDEEEQDRQTKRGGWEIRGFGEDGERRRRGGWKSGTETERGRKRKRAAHTVHMRDRPSAYEAAGIDQPKSATTPGVLLRALLFSARRAVRARVQGSCAVRRRRTAREVDG